jgi:hypothetical protein
MSPCRAKENASAKTMIVKIGIAHAFEIIKFVDMNVVVRKKIVEIPETKN